MVKEKRVYFLAFALFLLLASVSSKDVLPCQGCRKANSENKCIECEKDYVLIQTLGLCIQRGSSDDKPATPKTTSSISFVDSPILPISNSDAALDIPAAKNNVAINLNQAPLLDAGCAKFVGTTCAECSFRWVQIQGICRKVSDDCLTWDSTGSCTLCYRGYNLINGECKVPSSTAEGSATKTLRELPGCAEIQDEVCVKCAYRYYAANRLCRPVSDLCKTWDDNNGACTTCYDGYEVAFGECKAKLLQTSVNNLPVRTDPQINPSLVSTISYVDNSEAPPMSTLSQPQQIIEEPIVIRAFISGPIADESKTFNSDTQSSQLASNLASIFSSETVMPASTFTTYSLPSSSTQSVQTEKQTAASSGVPISENLSTVANSSFEITKWLESLPAETTYNAEYFAKLRETYASNPGAVPWPEGSAKTQANLRNNGH